MPQPTVWITSVGSEIYWSGEDGLTLDTDFADQIERDWRPQEVERALDVMPGLEEQAHYEQRRFKRSYFVGEEGVVDEVRRRLDEGKVEARVILSHGHLLDVLPANAGKGAAMLHVAKRLRVPVDRLIAIGDSGNDHDMLSICENSVMVANYSGELSDLVGQSGLYVAQRRHAAGALEGIVAYHARSRRNSSERKAA